MDTRRNFSACGRSRSSKTQITGNDTCVDTLQPSYEPSWIQAVIWIKDVLMARIKVKTVPWRLPDRTVAFERYGARSMTRYPPSRCTQSSSARRWASSGRGLAPAVSSGGSGHRRYRCPHVLRLATQRSPLRCFEQGRQMRHETHRPCSPPLVVPGHAWPRKLLDSAPQAPCSASLHLCGTRPGRVAIRPVGQRAAAVLAG